MDLFFFLVKSQTNYKTLRKESMMTLGVIGIAAITKMKLVKNYQIANIKETNPKSRNCFEKFKLMQMELRLKSNLITRKMKSEKSVQY